MKRVALLALLAASPVFAIVITTGDPNSSIYTVGYQGSVGGVNLSGVVKITSSRGGCSGSLLGDGFSILTAAHCVTTSFGAATATGITVDFQGPAGDVPFTVDLTVVDPAYTGDSTVGGDLAVLHLSSLAPGYASRYSLFTGSRPSSPLVIAGYGYTGVGATGYDSSTFGTLRAGTNEYVTNGTTLGWSSTLLIGQFYDANRSSSNALDVASPYSAANEVDIAPGDSGGPSFYNGYIVGVHDLIACLGPNSGCSVPPSATTNLTSSFGQIFADVSVASNREFIDAQLVPEPSTLMPGAPLLIWLVASRRRRRG